MSSKKPPATTPQDNADAPNPLFELASISPQVAIEAALALMASPSSQTRALGVELGIKTARTLGPKTRASAPLADFCATMLSGDIAHAIDFLNQCKPLALKIAPFVVERLGADRSMALEDSLPGFASKLTAQQLSQSPELCGALRARGLIPITKAFDAQTRAAGIIWQLQYYKAKLTAREQASYDKSLTYFQKAQQRHPATSAEHWEHFWNCTEACDYSNYSIAVAATLSEPANPFAPLQKPDLLSSKQLGSLSKLIRATHDRGSRTLGRHLGTYLADASDEFIERLFKSETHRFEPLNIAFSGRSDKLSFSSLNKAARILEMFNPSGFNLARNNARYADDNPSRAHAQNHSDHLELMLGVCEGLASKNCPSPVFTMIAPPEPQKHPLANGSGYIDQSSLHQRTQWPHDMICKIGPAVFFAGHAQPSDPALLWLTAGADPKERATIQSWLNLVSTLPGAGQMRSELGQTTAFIEALDLASQTTNPRDPNKPTHRL